MNRRECIVTTAKLIIEAHGGQAGFNLREAAKIIGCHPRYVALKLNECGVLCTTCGKNKMVAAVGIAECIHFNQVSPLDNSLRPAKERAAVKRGGAGRRAKGGAGLGRGENAASENRVKISSGRR